MSIAATAGTENAELTVHFQIALHDADWTRVPLRLDQGLLGEPEQYQGPGESFIHFQGNGEGYVLWIRSNKEGLHDITLKMLVPLSQIGEETKLKLFTPRAAAAELKLKVPQANAVATVSEGSTLLSTAAGQEGGTLLTVLGLGGEFQLAWHKAGIPTAEVPPVLEASGNILARLDNQGITSEADLTVHSYGAPLDRFVVRLSPQSELTSGNTQGYMVSPLEGTKDPGGGQSQVEVRLHKKTAGPVEVRLTARRNFAHEQSPDGFDLAGFEVAGAARQWGTVAVAAGNERQIIWGRQQGVRQVDPLPEPLRSEGVIAGFEYSAQPFTLNVRLAPRKTHINVEPEYVLFVSQDRVQLEAKLSCFIRGAKLNVLLLAMPDWEIDEAQPENLVALDGIDRDENGMLSLPLHQPTAGKLELRLRT